jgi:hypothetical protein
VGAVNNITEYGNAITYPKVLSDLMAPAFVKATCMMNLIHAEDLPALSMVKQFTKDGSLTAATLAQSTALAIDSNGELTRTAVDATASKCAVSSGISVEALRFSDIDLDTIATRQASAIARFVDNDALSLLGGFSTAVTSVAGLTIDDIQLGQYNIYNSECPNKEVPLAVVIAHKGHYEIKKEIQSSGASAWTSQAMLGILQARPQANCYAGSLPNLDFYATSGFGTSGGDNQQGIFHPMWALAGMFDTAPVLVTNMKGSEGLYQEAVSYYFYDIVEWNDAAGVNLNSNT